MKLYLLNDDCFETNEVIIRKGVKYVASKKELYIKDKYLHLTKKESQLFDLFLKNKNKIIDKETLNQELWGENEQKQGLYALVVKLKAKLPSNIFEIMSIRNKGYMLKA